MGKAISLKNRVRQYFQKSRHVTPKIQRMIDRIAWFEYIVTDSELEALVLECNLIKKYMPKYNVLLRDDKTYPYIKVTVKEDFPRILRPGEWWRTAPDISVRTVTRVRSMRSSICSTASIC